jgi:hypothetical protein
LLQPLWPKPLLQRLLRRKRLSLLPLLQRLLRRKRLSQQPSLLIKRPSLPKASLLRSKPVRVIVLDLEDSEVEVEFVEGLHRGYSRPKVQDDNEDDPDYVPDHIRWKLFLARQLALIKYRKKWAV